MFATCSEWAGPSHFGGRTGNLQNRILVWGPALIFPNSLASPVSGPFELVPEYAGETNLVGSGSHQPIV